MMDLIESAFVHDLMGRHSKPDLHSAG